MRREGAGHSLCGLCRFKALLEGSAGLDGSRCQTRDGDSFAAAVGGLGGTAATCGNHLTLPPYTSQQRMLESVTQAIEVCQDFGAEG